MSTKGSSVRPIALFALAALILPGCASSGPVPVPVPDANTLSGGREWWDVYGIEYQGEKKVRTKCGYLYRKYDADNTGGFYWVQNMEQEEIGFLLPDQKAYLIKTLPDGKKVSEDLGVKDIIIGVRKILQVPGTIELEKVTLKADGQVAERR